MDWLPDLRVGTLEIRDLANLVVAGLGAFLAYLAIKLGKQQSAIAKRQGEIAESQHQIMVHQMRKRPVLVFNIAGLALDLTRETERVYRYSIAIENKGTKACDKISWHLYILLPDAMEHVEIPQEMAQYQRISEPLGLTFHVHFAGIHELPLYPRPAQAAGRIDTSCEG